MFQIVSYINWGCRLHLQLERKKFRFSCCCLSKHLISIWRVIVILEILFAKILSSSQTKSRKNNSWNQLKQTEMFVQSLSTVRSVWWTLLIRLITKWKFHFMEYWMYELHWLTLCWDKIDFAQSKTGSANESPQAEPWNAHNVWLLFDVCVFVCHNEPRIMSRGASLKNTTKQHQSYSEWKNKVIVMAFLISISQ